MHKNIIFLFFISFFIQISHACESLDINDPFDCRIVRTIVDGYESEKKKIRLVEPKHLIFFIPYAQVHIALYDFTLENCIVKNIVKDICTFCDPENFNEEKLGQKYFNKYFKRIVDTIKQKSLIEKEALLEKALQEKNFSNIVFLLYIINGSQLPKLPYRVKLSFHNRESYEDCFYNNHSITGKNRIYSASTHEQRMLLAQANCSIFIGRRIVYEKNMFEKDFDSYEIEVTSFIRALEGKHIDIAESLLIIMVEQGCDLSSCIDDCIYEKIGLIPYLLNSFPNNNACNIIEILIKNKFGLNNECMRGATSDQKKIIVNIYCEIFDNPWDRMINCLFLHNAVNQGDLDLVKFLLDKGADINLLSEEFSGCQPIAYALKNEEMCDFFIDNKTKLKLRFSTYKNNYLWLEPQVEKNVIKMVDNGLFSDKDTLFSLINGAIEKDRFDLFKCALDQYKKLNGGHEQWFFKTAITEEKKDVAHYLLENDCNINLLWMKSDYLYKYDIKRVISLIDDKFLIKNYEKNKKNMNRDDWFLLLKCAEEVHEESKKNMKSSGWFFWLKCAEKVQKLDFIHYLLNNSDVGIKKLIWSPTLRTIEEKINDALNSLDIKIIKKQTEIKKQKSIKRYFCHLINKEQKRLRLIE